MNYNTRQKWAMPKTCGQLCNASRFLTFLCFLKLKTSYQPFICHFLISHLFCRIFLGNNLLLPFVLLSSGGDYTEQKRHSRQITKAALYRPLGLLLNTSPIALKVLNTLLWRTSPSKIKRAFLPRPEVLPRNATPLFIMGNPVSAALVDLGISQINACL